MIRVAGDGIVAPFAAVAGEYVLVDWHLTWLQGQPVEEIIGVWEHRDEYLGRIHKGRRLGIGPEPDNRHINTGNTVDDFQVHANDWFDLHWLSSQKGDLVLVWHWSVWWHAIVKYVARRKGTLTIACFCRAASRRCQRDVDNSHV